LDIVPIYFKHFKQCVKNGERYVVLRGSSRSAKTYSVCQWFYYLAKKGIKFELTIVGHSIPFLRDGVYNSFKQIAPNENFIKSPFSVKIDNAEILFRSFKDEDDAKSAERDFLYVNECNHIPYAVIQQLVMRTRLMCFFDFNPTKHFWIDDYVNGSNIIHTTFKDNPFLSDAQIENFEKIKERAERLTASAYDKYLYSVYYLGEYGDISGNVFSQITEINDEEYLLAVGDKKIFGLDFGFSQDPCALVELTFKDGKYVAKELLYKSGLNDFKLAEIIKSHAKDDEIIVCDWGAGGDARISNLFELTGLSFARAVKGEGSIKNGVELINSKHFLLHGENINREFKGYEFKDGAFVDKENHCCDSVRYSLDYAIRSNYFD
jgi:phage terminase large subunit